MAAEGLYSAYAAKIDAAQDAGVDAVLAAALGEIAPVLKWAITMAVVAGGVAVMYSRMSMDRLAVWMVRALAVAYLIGGAAQYNPIVRNTFMADVPNWIASTVNGGGQRIQAGEQFDRLRARMDNLTAQVAKEATGWSIAAFAARASAEAARWWYGISLEITFAIWLLGKRLMGLVIAMGPFLLSFELFENTRGFVRHWIGTAVGLACFQLATAVQLQISSRGLMEFLSQIRGRMGTDLDGMVAVLQQAAGWAAMDAIAMFSIPTICAVGSGVAVQTAAGSRAVQAMAQRGVNLGARAGGAATAAGQRARGLAAKAYTAARRRA